MSRYLILREKGSAETLMIDKATLKVVRLDAEAANAFEQAAKRSEAAPFAGLEFAHAVEYRDKAPARMLYREELPLAS